MTLSIASSCDNLKTTVKHYALMFCPILAYWDIIEACEILAAQYVCRYLVQEKDTQFHYFLARTA